MLEHPMITQINQSGYPAASQEDYQNMIWQPEHYGCDFYGTEVFEGDEIVIDEANFEELILREHLKRYLIEKCHFLYKAGIYVDMDQEEIILEEGLETYLSGVHGFQFMQAK